MARNFFLNERHELIAAEKKRGFGSGPNLRAIDWKKKSATLKASFSKLKTGFAASVDPTQGSHIFVAAAPDTIPKFKTTKGKREDIDEKAEFRGTRSVDLARLGFDLLEVSPSGEALVHARPALIEQLERTATSLDSESDRIRNRWLAIRDLSVPSGDWRLDLEWHESLGTAAVDSIVEMQPVLEREAVEQVMQLVLELVGGDSRPKAAGTDYSGRHWFKLALNKKVLRVIANALPSIQLLHPPFGTALAAARHAPAFQIQEAAGPVRAPEPVVGIIDTGISPRHRVLDPYRFLNGWRSQWAAVAGYREHPSNVASRVVFGEISPGASAIPQGDTAFFDVAVGILQNTRSGDVRLDDKDIMASLIGARGASPELRTFVFPFDTDPVGLLPPAEAREKLRLVRDLDNFIVDNDVVVVVSAGNVPREQIDPEYPGDLDNPVRHLGPWASAHNTLTCGAFVRAGDSALAQADLAPSPFTRLGPGIAAARGVPEAAEHGGGENGGALVLGEDGRWRSTSGTSFAAPLLARKVAHAFTMLKSYVPEGERVSSSLVKAFLAMTARPIAETLPPAMRPLAKRTLGFGQMSLDRLVKPSERIPTFLWQGAIETSDEIVRVLLPFPARWFEKATAPTLRVMAAWNTYVNDAASDLWACRRVELQLRIGPDMADEAGHGGSVQLGSTYPLSERFYDLKKVLKKQNVRGDGFVLCLSYKTDGMAPTPGLLNALPRQQVAFAAELFDESGSTSPYQELVMLEPRIGLMDRLRAAVVPLPIRVR